MQPHHPPLCCIRPVFMHFRHQVGKYKWLWTSPGLSDQFSEEAAHSTGLFQNYSGFFSLSVKMWNSCAPQDSDRHSSSSLETFLPEDLIHIQALGMAAPVWSTAGPLLVFSTSGARHVSSVQAVWGCKSLCKLHIVPKGISSFESVLTTPDSLLPFCDSKPQAVHCKCMQLTTPGSTRKTG